MKKQHLIPASIAILIIGLILLTPACRKTAPAPAACISSLPDTVYANVPVSFYSCTAGAKSYLWNFGDGSTAATDSATHTYTTAGVYHGSLTIANGQSNTKNFSIVVVADPMGYITSSHGTFLINSWDTAYGIEIGASDTANEMTEDHIGFVFYGGFPPAAGSYLPVFAYASQAQATPGTVAVGISFHNDSLVYGASAANTHRVTVSYNQSNKMNISGTGIEVININNPSDSFAATFNITQP